MKLKERTHKKIKSIKIKLFASLCIVIVITILFLIIINNIVLETFYIYNKKDTVKAVCESINEKFLSGVTAEELQEFIKLEASRNNLDILITDGASNYLFANDKKKAESLKRIQDVISFDDEEKFGEILYSAKDMIITIVKDENNNDKIYIVLMGRLENNNIIYIATPVSAIKESLKVSNNVLFLAGAISVLVSAVIVLIVCKRFSNPILELNDIAKRMSKLDFSQKYVPSKSDDEIDELGNSINMMSDKLEETIKEFRKNNDELERDIKEKSKIEEMRTQFISDVSHELKTPIALIQGYAEGLVENVNNDDESRKYYAEVILDEADKMDKLVKQLLEIMKLEYGKREFNNFKFNIVSLIKEVLRRCDVMIKEEKINAILENENPIYVFADDFYIEQVVTNYITNAIRYSKVVDGKREIIVNITEMENGNARISVFNTGNNLSDEERKLIWARFTKLDNSRNRANGGTGIGLSLVRAVMNNYNKPYGVINKPNGVEFYFELNMKEINEEEINEEE